MEQFVSGDKVDWADDGYKEGMIRAFGAGPFIVRGVENDAPDETGQVFQSIAIEKIVDGKKYAWVSHKRSWIEDAPMFDDRGRRAYMAVPPTFTNICFKKVS